MALSSYITDFGCTASFLLMKDWSPVNSNAPDASSIVGYDEEKAKKGWLAQSLHHAYFPV